MHIGDYESSSRPQHAKDLARVCFEIEEIALIQIRNGQVEASIAEEAQIFGICNPIGFLLRLQLAGSVNHRLASINPHHPLRAALDEDPAEAALAASTVENGEIADVAAGCQHGLSKRPSRDGILRSRACLIQAGASRTHSCRSSVSFMLIRLFR